MCLVTLRNTYRICHEVYEVVISYSLQIDLGMSVGPSAQSKHDLRRKLKFKENIYLKSCSTYFQVAKCFSF